MAMAERKDKGQMTRPEREAAVVRAAMRVYVDWKRRNPAMWTAIIGLGGNDFMNKEANTFLRSCAALHRTRGRKG